MNVAQRNRAFAERLVSSLVDHGLTDALLCPGSRNTPLALALDGHPEVRAQTILDERAAGFVALGIGRAAGRAAAVCCTSGSAAAHLLPAVIEASHSRVPLLVLSADRPRELLQCGAPQTIDQNHLFGRHARWFFDFGAVGADDQTDWVGTVATQAWLQAHGAEAGAVQLNVPLAEPLWSPEVESGSPATQRRTIRLERGVVGLSEQQLERLGERSTAAQRGLIVCGPIDPASLPGGAGGAARQGLARAVEALAEALGWPVLADACSPLRFRPEVSASLIANGDALARSPTLRASLKPDLVLRLGQVPTSKALGEWLAEVGADETILIDPGGKWQDPYHRAGMLVVAEPTQLCRALVAHLDERTTRAATTDAWLARWQAADRLAGRLLHEACRTDGAQGEPDARRAEDAPWEPEVIARLFERLPVGTLVHAASSMPVRDIDSFGGGTGAELTLVSNRGANGIDGLVATAAGEALVLDQLRAVLVCGDLAFLHDIGGLAAAAQLPIRLLIVLLDNGGGGIFEYLAIAKHPTAFETRFLTPQTTSPAELCAAVGAQYLPVTRRGELTDALAAGLQHDRLSVVHVRIDRAVSVARHRETFARIDESLAALARQW
jgi:2-succinyl-5-enolpyruvyl-6-hydroxy-3-cyclohexene-1-carboxylate synthase